MSYYAPFYQPNNFYTPNQQNGFMGQNYAPQAYPNQQQVNVSQNTQQFPVENDMLWVLNKNEADSYPVAPNHSVVLWDKNSQTIYIKSMSANGIPSMRTLDYKERVENAQNDTENQLKSLDDKFVTLEQFNDLKGDFDDFKAMYASVNKEEPKKDVKSTSKNSKNEV